MVEDCTPYAHLDRAEVRQYIPWSSRSLLDIGCSSGAFGQGLKKERPSLCVTGLEPSASAAAIARRHLDRVISGSYPEDAPDERFDCVVFNDVLEHLADPWTSLAYARGLLHPGGKVIASIPNVRHFSVLLPLLLHGQWRYRDVGILDKTHLRFFTRSTMVELFESTGWKVEQIEASRLTEPSSGEIPRVLALLGRRADEFRAINYVVVAS